MRPGRGFGVILNAGEGMFLVLQPFNRLVVQVYVGDSDVAFERIGIHGEAVILGSYLHLSGFKVFNRLVSSAMPEFEFEGLSSECETQDLVSQADSEDGFFSDKFFYVFRGVFDRGRVSGSV